MNTIVLMTEGRVWSLDAFIVIEKLDQWCGPLLPRCAEGQDRRNAAAMRGAIARIALPR